MQDEKHRFSGKAPQYCDLRLYPRLRYISSARQVHLPKCTFKATLSAQEVPPNQSTGTEKPECRAVPLAGGTRAGDS